MAKMIVPKEEKKDPLIYKRINRQPINVDSIEAMTPDTDKMVSGTFINKECPGQSAKICAKLYKGMEYFSRTFQDGEKTTIPLSVARFINERIQYTKHSYILDEQGNPIKSDKPEPRYQFAASF